MRVWLSTFPRAGQTEEVGRAAEAAGFHGLLLTDSQCLAGDPFVELGAVADATTSLHLGTCASNVVTRHPTVVASLAMTLQARSGGRMTLGIARGDSAVTKVGLHPIATEGFGAVLDELRRLLRGDSVEIDGDPVSLAWVDGAMAPPPVIGVASGPHAIAEVARHADGLILQVGSDPAAIARCVEEARSTRAHGDFTIAAYVIVGLEVDGSAPPIGGVTPLLARMAAETLGDGSSPQAQASAEAVRAYTLATHGLAEAGEGHPEIEDYAVRGTPQECMESLRVIAGTGCDELVVILGSMTTPTPELRDLIAAFGDRVLPALIGIEPNRRDPASS